MAEIIVTQSTAEGPRSDHKSDLHAALHGALKAAWFPTYTELVNGVQAEDKSSEQAKLQQSWTRLGEIIGLSVERERIAYEREARRKATCCAWKDCRWHRTPPPLPPRVCKGCGEARYCSKECQTK